MGKPTNAQEMKAFLDTGSISEHTNVHGMLIRQGWAEDDEGAGKLMNDCGWHTTLSSEDGWEPGIT
jgi:hypothetical protein